MRGPAAPADPENLHERGMSVHPDDPIQRGCTLLDPLDMQQIGQTAGLAIQIEDGNLCERCIHARYIQVFAEDGRRNASRMRNIV